MTYFKFVNDIYLSIYLFIIYHIINLTKTIFFEKMSENSSGRRELFGKTNEKFYANLSEILIKVII